MTFGSNPSGLCMCGCGQQTPIAKRTRTDLGHVKGTPVKYVSGHTGQWQQLPDGPNPSGVCMCGCGRPTTLARQSHTETGAVRGKPTRYLVGHQHRKSPVDYITDDNDCWVWQRGRYPQGYGKTVHNGSPVPAHRAYYEQYVGAIPDGLEIDHLCRNRACVNPDHLEPVTHAENCRRGLRTKLTFEQVRDLRRSDEHPNDVARRLGIGASTVINIRAGRSWPEEKAA